MNAEDAVVEYIGPPSDSHHFVDAARQEGLDAQYSPIMSARRGNEIFEVGEVTLAGSDLRNRSVNAMNRVLQRFPVGHMGFRGINLTTSSNEHEVNLHGFMRVLPNSARIVLSSNDLSGKHSASGTP